MSEEMRLGREPTASQRARLPVPPAVTRETVEMHAVDDHVAAVCGLQHIAGVEPARGVIPVTEHEHQGASHGLLAQGEAANVAS